MTAHQTWPSVDFTPADERHRESQQFEFYWNIEPDLFLLYYLNNRYRQTINPDLTEEGEPWARIDYQLEGGPNNGKTKSCLASFYNVRNVPVQEDEEGNRVVYPESVVRYRQRPGFQWTFVPTNNTQHHGRVLIEEYVRALSWDYIELEVYRLSNPIEFIVVVTTGDQQDTIKKDVRRIELYTTWTAFATMMYLYQKEADLVRIREIPENARPWAHFVHDAHRGWAAVHKGQFISVYAGYRHLAEQGSQSKGKSKKRQHAVLDSEDEEGDEENIGEQERRGMERDISIFGRYFQGYAADSKILSGAKEYTWMQDLFRKDVQSLLEPIEYELFFTDNMHYLRKMNRDLCFEIRSERVTVETHCQAHLRETYKTPDSSRWIWSLLDAQADRKDLSLFVCCDNNNTIQERSFVQHLQRRKDERENEDDRFSVVPRELFLLEHVRALPSKEFPTKRFLPEIESTSEHHSSTHPHCAYFEFSEQVSLSQVQNDFIRQFKTNPESNSKFLPEAFIWIIFRNLVLACNKLNAADSGSEDSGSEDNRPKDNRPKDNRPKDNRPKDNRPEDNGSDSNGSDSNGSDSIGSDSIGSDSNGSDSNGSDSNWLARNESDNDGSDSDGADSDGLDSNGSDNSGQSQDFVLADINPSNIRIRSARPAIEKNDFPAFGVPILSNLAQYYRLWSNLSSERILDGDPQPYYPAPEQRGPFPHTPVALGVYQIGLTIWCLMRNRVDRINIPASCEDSDKSWDEWFQDQQDRERHDGFYSTKLESLVASCLAENLSKRPEIDDLREDVVNGFNQMAKHCEGLQELAEEQLPDYMRVLRGALRDGSFSTGRTFDAGRKRRSWN